MSITELSITDIELQPKTDPIWVLNNSKRSRIKEAGNVIIGIKQINGDQRDPLTVMQTWLPQRVNLQFTTDQILSSSEFRAALHKRLIVLIDDKTATKLLAKAEAKREQKRLDTMANNVAAAGAARGISSDLVTIIGPDGKADAPEEMVALNGEAAEPKEPGANLEPRFKGWADRLVADGKDDLDIKSEIQAQDQLKKSQVLYLLHILDTGVYPKTTGMLNRAIGR
jgi:hypothetical protein